MLTVLVVDDDMDWRLLLRRMLMQNNCDSLQASNGIEGEKLAMESRPDLVLLDIMMPIQDGYQTCKNLRSNGYTGKIILMSAMQEDAGKEKAVECQANAYLQKPITGKVLRLHLDHLGA